MLTQLFPILTTPDLDRALRFYRDLLGAKVTYQFPAEGDPGYVSLRVGDSALGIGRQEEPGTLTNNRISLWAYVTDCDEVIATLREAGVPVLKPPADQPWGERMATVEDPDGNVVHIATADS
jgi:lactoylglutathione lyase